MERGSGHFAYLRIVSDSKGRDLDQKIETGEETGARKKRLKAHVDNRSSLNWKCVNEESEPLDKYARRRETPAPRGLIDVSRTTRLVALRPLGAGIFRHFRRPTATAFIGRDISRANSPCKYVGCARTRCMYVLRPTVVRVAVSCRLSSQRNATF